MTDREGAVQETHRLLVRYSDDDDIWHERIVLLCLGGTKYLIGTPDGDVYVEDLAEYSAWKRCGARGGVPVELRGERLYRFAEVILLVAVLFARTCSPKGIDNDRNFVSNILHTLRPLPQMLLGLIHFGLAILLGCLSMTMILRGCLRSLGQERRSMSLLPIFLVLYWLAIGASSTLMELPSSSAWPPLLLNYPCENMQPSNLGPQLFAGLQMDYKMQPLSSLASQTISKGFS